MWETLLFADGDDVWWAAALGVAGPLVGGAVVWLYTQWTKYRAQNRTERKEDEKDIVAHQKELIERQDKALAMQERENENLRGEIRKLWAEVRDWELRVVRLRSHVEYLEGSMLDAGMKFRPYAEERPVKPAEAKA